VNAEPESGGWFARVRIADRAEYDALMDRAAYDAFLETL
jgi:glycine cleavage system H protein